VVFTQVDRDSANRPSLTHHSFRLDAGEYFFPASLVKLPTALLALEKAAELGLGLDTRLRPLRPRSPLPEPDSLADNDCRYAGPTLAELVKKVFLVSGNDPHNLLYAFVGQARLQERLAQMGYPLARVNTPLASPCAEAYNTQVAAFEFLDERGRRLALLPALGPVPMPQPLPTANMTLGANALDCTAKNFLPLWDAHQMVVALFLPEALPAEQRFRLGQAELDLARRHMGLAPREAEFDQYRGGSLDDEGRPYVDAYSDYLFYGGRQSPIDHWPARVFNKVGRAYGFMTDCAYIVDFEHGVEFFLSATIWANQNQVMGDGIYEYQSVGYPFLRALGQAFWEHEKGRAKRHPPRLDSLRALLP